MNVPEDSGAAEVLIEGDQLLCRGDWSTEGIADLSYKYSRLSIPEAAEIEVVDDGISEFDSAGAWLLNKIVSEIKKANKNIKIEKFSKAKSELIDIVSADIDDLKIPKAPKLIPNWLYFIGLKAVEKYNQAEVFLNFLGEVAYRLYTRIKSSGNWQVKSMIDIVDDTGYRALPIVALLMFLIGVVLAYQIGQELKIYGASVFIVELSGLAIFREFGPLITAILVAGRTSSSFTARLGTMKVSEEIDALRTMGLSPVDRLVIPRVVGLLVALPLLTVWADIFGVFGSMVMSRGIADISYVGFLQRFASSVPIKHFWVGMSKTPVFAIVIASVGCFQGLQVEGSSESVGKQTTKSVVQAIFLIIIIDALFSIMYSWLGI